MSNSSPSWIRSRGEVLRRLKLRCLQLLLKLPAIVREQLEDEERLSADSALRPSSPSSPLASSPLPAPAALEREDEQGAAFDNTIEAADSLSSYFPLNSAVAFNASLVNSISEESKNAAGRKKSSKADSSAKHGNGAGGFDDSDTELEFFASQSQKTEDTDILSKAETDSLSKAAVAVNKCKPSSKANRDEKSDASSSGLDVDDSDYIASHSDDDYDSADTDEETASVLAQRKKRRSAASAKTASAAVREPMINFGMSSSWSAMAKLSRYNTSPDKFRSGGGVKLSDFFP
jgi:hypothetical protein